MFTGDSKFCGRTEKQIEKHGLDYPLRLVAETLSAADICFGNCETALTDCRSQTPGKPAWAVAAGKAFVFKSDPDCSADVLSQAGFDILQLANNHTMDYCAEGLLDTLATLDGCGITYVGAGRDSLEAASPVVLEHNSVRVGFLAYSLIVPPGSAASSSAGINTLGADYQARLKQDIAGLEPRCDLVVVGMHWGKESRSVPDAWQRRVGRAAVIAGADLVIGSHPHSMQGVEFYEDGVIAYSLGNFVFTGASPLLSGCILRVTAAAASTESEVEVAGVALLPCWIRDGRPEPSQDAKLRKQLENTMRQTGSALASTDTAWLEILRAE